MKLSEGSSVRIIEIPTLPSDSVGVDQILHELSSKGKRKRRNKTKGGSGTAPSLGRVMNNNLLALVTMEEIKCVVDQLGALKAPGPNVFPILFYQKYWNIVDKVVFKSSKEFLNGRVEIYTMDMTNIVLIPKVDSPESTINFRPISLCNNSYKILSKFLDNRLREVLPALISPNQNAFVPDRQIQDNLLLAHESYHYLKSKMEGGKHELGLKLDMNKVYDLVEWDFLEGVLLRFGFASEWVKIIMSCVTTVSFSIVLNGRLGKTFQPSRGFTFSSHPKNIMQLTLLFKEYGLASSQVINGAKSSVYFTPNTPEQMALLFCELIGFMEVKNPGTYLGLPTIWDRSKKEAPSFINDKVKRKIKGWKEKSLSLACKECRRLQSEPNSLWARVMKARYFSKCGFMQAVKDHRPSWSWTSLLKARDELLLDSKWLIGGGESVNFWYDQWLSLPGNGQVKALPIIRDPPNTYVHSLIDWGNRAWNLSYVANLLHLSMIPAITSTPLGNKGEKDKLVWPHCKDGSYNVKDGCNFVYKGAPPSAHFVIKYASNQASKYLGAQILPVIVYVSSSIIPNVNWYAPPISLFKVNCDAAWKQPNLAGLGVVIKNHNGESVAGLSKQMHVGNVDTAENLACSLGLKEVILESDSLHAIKDLKRYKCINRKTYHIISQIRAKLIGFDSFSWNWVPIKANRAAHIAAKLSYRSEGPHN
ncbi:uncharacterized protein LOC126797246 [Argentina anserina]|uniref:uncharacterized protein LOC126797246 n=1 Tax=Argentina anserina TaxID=57926 RepID=UPI002176283D|nr:uncharacterized protein LOC126797246 [Potentilla anserina]